MLSAMLFAVFILGCGKSTQKIDASHKSKAERSIEMGAPAAEGLSQNIILGRIVSLWINASNESAIEACQDHPCEAKVEILAVEQRSNAGFNALEAGTILLGYFEFTLSSTESIFPELNHHLPGLKEGDIFRSEVQLTEQGTLTIGAYTRIE